jgi:8-oxo-dGTP pyrophosphatase MutT (NUDIX family)
MMDRWVINSRKTMLSGKIYSLEDLDCTLPSKGISHTFNIIKAPDWINIVAQTDDGEVLFVRQHRLGTDEITIETPAGMIEDGEDPFEAAKRELAEETGYHAGKIVLMKTLHANPAIMTNRIYFFFASGCTKKGNQKLDREESISVEKYSVEETAGMIQSGIINHSIIVTALTLFLLSEYQEKQIRII